MNMLTLLLSLTSSNTIHAEQERQKGKKRSERWEVETGTILRDRCTAYLSLWGFLTKYVFVFNLSYQPQKQCFVGQR